MIQFHASKGIMVFPCLANNPGQFSQNVLPSASNVCRTVYFTRFVLSFRLETTISSFRIVATVANHPT